MTDITPRDITRALRTYLPHATLRTTAGYNPGEFDVRLPQAAHDHMAGPHGLAAALGSRLGTEFGVDGVTWSKRGDKAATVHLYTRSSRRARSAAAVRAERDRQRELARPKATLPEALDALDNRPRTGPGTGITEGITLNEKLALGALVKTVRAHLAAFGADEVKDAQVAMARMYEAAVGDSNDDEHEAGMECADQLGVFLSRMGYESPDPGDYTGEDEDEDLGYIGCDEQDGERSYACTGDGVRVCNSHALDAARRGEDLEWDDDCSQLVKAEADALRAGHGDAGENYEDARSETS